MKIERIARDKVRIFISYDDLERRGIDKDEIWHNGKKVQELFWDMMETAYEEVGFEVAGPISIEAFTMPSEGVVIIVTRVPSFPVHKEDDEEDDEDERDSLDFEIPSPLDSNFVFKFYDFEDVVQISYALVDYAVLSRLYQHDGAYLLAIDENSMSDDEYDSIWSILQEYGEYSAISPTWLDEYGTCVLDKEAIQTIVFHFPLQ